MILAILQARMSSSRLPGKVLADLAGAPMILRQIERLGRARRLDRIVVATSIEPSDDGLAQLLERAGVAVHRGDLNDVLGRFGTALDQWGPADDVVRLTADCPLADPSVIDATIDLHRAAGADYTSNVAEPRTFPKGLDVEVVATRALRIALSEAVSPYDREHVTPYFYQNPQRFSVAAYAQSLTEGELRWTVDRPDDLDFVRAVYDALYPLNPAFSSADVRAFLQTRPDLAHLGGDRRI
jgi:spore coat polysaccharide biosynthesis protein SpsF